MMTLKNQLHSTEKADFSLLGNDKRKALMWYEHTNQRLSPPPQSTVLKTKTKDEEHLFNK